MDLDKAFVNSMLAEGKDAFKAARTKGIEPDSLEGPASLQYEYIISYHKTYSALPSPFAVLQKTGVEVGEAPPDPASFYADEVLNRRLHNRLREGMAEATVHIELQSPRDALGVLTDAVKNAQRYDQVEARTVNMFTLGDEVIEYYEKIKRGERGIVTRWPTLNEVTLGFWPKDLILFAARMGTGKSWVACIIAHDAWAAGKKVLLVTTEMAQLGLARRFFAIHNNLHYNEFRTGRLGMPAETVFKDSVERLRSADGLHVVGGQFDFQIASLEAAIDDVEPDLVIVDGAYLLKTQGKNRTERAANIFDELKRMAIRYNVPVMATTQLNRDAKQDSPKSIQADTVAMTDVAGWNADLLIGLVQTSDMKQDKRMIMKFLKAREAYADQLELTWDHEMMDFSELSDDTNTGDTSFGLSADDSDDGGDDIFGASF